MSVTASWQSFYIDIAASLIAFWDRGNGAHAPRNALRFAAWRRILPQAECARAPRVGAKKCGLAAFQKVREDTEIEKAAVWGYASRLVFIAFITVSIVSSASAKAITASQN